MFVCPFCDHEHRKIKNINKKHVEEHLIVMKMGDHIHVHGPVNDKFIMKEFILAIARESSIEIED